jgi:hypothetical protein
MLFCGNDWVQRMYPMTPFVASSPFDTILYEQNLAAEQNPDLAPRLVMRAGLTYEATMTPRRHLFPRQFPSAGAGL